MNSKTTSPNTETRVLTPKEEADLRTLIESWFEPKPSPTGPFYVRVRAEEPRLRDPVADDWFR